LHPESDDREDHMGSAFLMADTTTSAATIPWADLLAAVVFGLGTACLIVLAAAKVTRKAWPEADENTNRGLAGAASWKFSDSWASNLTAVTAAGAAIFTGISDKVSGAFTPGALAGYAVTTTVFLLIAALSPLAYAACQKVEPDPDAKVQGGGGPPAPAEPEHPAAVTTLRGTVPGLFLATGLTIFAVMGALVATGFLVFHSTIAGWWRTLPVVALVLIAVLVGVYSVQSIRWLLADARTPRQKPPTVPSEPPVPGYIRVDAKRGRIMSLL
jgi:hypothetical protein